MKTNTQMAVIHISDHTAQQILDMAKDFFSKEENIKRYEKWHLETYGCLPD